MLLLKDFIQNYFSFYISLKYYNCKLNRVLFYLFIINEMIKIYYNSVEFLYSKFHGEKVYKGKPYLQCRISYHLVKSVVTHKKIDFFIHT